MKSWREWRAAELERDLAYCHPRWPQEAQYLRAEIKAVRNLSLISGSDWWIYFDWASLVLILATIASHVTFFHYSNDTSKEVHHYILIPLLLILWFRIFKYARPFEGAGPFVVIFGHVLGDIVKWAFLNSIIVIPFTCAFWITFGAISLKPVAGYDNVGPLLYNIFSMMVVSNHDYDKLEEANPVMARLLCGAFIGIAAIVTLNLLIALLTNTFERLYENAVANAVMQRARTILLLQKSLRKKHKKKYYDFIKTSGSPEIIVKTLGRLLSMDGDDHATIERVRDDVKVVVSILSEKFGRKFGKGKKSDLEWVKMDITKIRRFQEGLILDVKNMKEALQKITEKLTSTDDNDVKDMKRILEEITGNMEEIKIKMNSYDNHIFKNTVENQTVGLPDKKNQSEDDPSDISETDSSDNEFGNSSNTQNVKMKKLINKRGQNDEESETGHLSKRNKASQVSPKINNDDYKNIGTAHQQPVYPYQSNFRIPGISPNTGCAFNNIPQYGYYNDYDIGMNSGYSQISSQGFKAYDQVSR